MGDQPTEPRSRSRRALPWLQWLLGAALFVAVVGFALHFSEAEEFVQLAERAKPRWLLVAVLLQAMTYWAQAQVWRCVARAGHFALPPRLAYALSLVKLFVDQALPSAGISGTVVIGRSLEEHGMPRPTVMATIVVNTASYYAAYVVTLAVAMLIAIRRHEANALVVAVAIAFALFAIAVTVGVLALSGRRDARSRQRLLRIRFLATAVKLIEGADASLARNPRLLLETGVYQVLIVLLDAATVWFAIRALGTTASVSGVFASFMISTLFRTIGVLPGGLGTFEATSVLTLKMIGVQLSVALSATLLFRGLSFWLPMIPGFLATRRVTPRRRGSLDDLART